MGFAVGQLTETNLYAQRADIELELTFITQELMALSMRSQAITEQQYREGQFYQLAHTDTEGQLDDGVIEYINSDAFRAKYDALLSAIDTKEKELDMRKTQLETKQKMISTQEEGWEKVTEKGIKNIFSYGS